MGVQEPEHADPFFEQEICSMADERTSGGIRGPLPKARFFAACGWSFTVAVLARQRIRVLLLYVTKARGWWATVPR